MLFFYPVRRDIFFILSALLSITTTSVSGQGPPSTQLGVMQTAETLGKGGYTTSFGMFQFDKKRLDKEPRQPQNVVIGNFEELHNVEFEIETFLLPLRLTYGVSERLDLTVGATFSTGGIRKIIPDFYGVGDANRDRRVYDQSVFDVVGGLKYNIKPDVNDGMPNVSFGGNLQIG
ncbi:MAG: hypothetical protein O7E52_21625, partial [Candidatus Poribacteria bacterium]|nr:hypothetical protein [Candidatus Poribacteria bacterium]